MPSNKTEKKICLKCGFVGRAGETTCPRDRSQLADFASDPLLGTTVAGKYEIVDLLGRGGMSVVYKARHKLMDRLVALKMLRAELASDEVSMKRFRKEAQAVSALRHPNIIPVFDFGMLENDSAYLVMEFLVGRDLDDLLKSDGPLDWHRAVSLFVPVCDALSHAHTMGVIHRDLKPSNIILTLDENDVPQPFVVDFGIAKVVAADGTTMHKLTSTGQVFGSPLYMSPEQASAKSADHRSDVYGIGCVLYQTLTGVAPIKGKSPVDTMMRQIQDYARPFSEVTPGASIPEAVEACIFKAIEKNPNDRFQTMDEFTSTLRMLAGKDQESMTESAPPQPIPKKQASSDQSGPESLTIVPGGESTASVASPGIQGVAHAKQAPSGAARFESVESPVVSEAEAPGSDPAFAEQPSGQRKTSTVSDLRKKAPQGRSSEAMTPGQIFASLAFLGLIALVGYLYLGPSLAPSQNPEEHEATHGSGFESETPLPNLLPVTLKVTRRGQLEGWKIVSSKSVDVNRPTSHSGIVYLVDLEKPPDQLSDALAELKERMLGKGELKVRLFPDHQPYPDDAKQDAKALVQAFLFPDPKYGIGEKMINNGYLVIFNHAGSLHVAQLIPTKTQGSAKVFLENEVLTRFQED